MWAAACADYNLGRVFDGAFPAARGPVVVTQTLTFMRAWTTLPFTEIERRTIIDACVTIGRGHTHPSLCLQGVPREPLGATMGSPIRGVSITWRPHWSDPTRTVLLTLDLDRPVTVVPGTSAILKGHFNRTQ